MNIIIKSLKLFLILSIKSKSLSAGNFVISSAMGPTKRSAAVLGSTGAVGKEIVKSLIHRNWDSIVLINRRNLKETSIVDTDGYKDKVREYIVDMENVETFESKCTEIFKEENSQAIFIAMGVGAPSKVDESTLRRADFELPAAFANGAKEGASSVKHVSILTAFGADKNAVPDTHDYFGLIPRTRAGGGLYTQLKGQIEETLKELSFPSLSTFRPAALIGTPNTPKMLEYISPFLDKILPAKYKSSRISTLGNAMVFDAETSLDRNEIHNSVVIFEGTSLHNLYKQSAGAKMEQPSHGGEL